MNLLLALSVAVLFGAGTFLMLKHDLIRMAAGVLMISNAVTLFIMSVGLSRGQAPIYPLEEGRPISDPVVQSLTLTAIVISFGLTALLLTIIYRVYTLYGTLRGPDDATQDDHERNDERATGTAQQEPDATRTEPGLMLLLPLIIAWTMAVVLALLDGRRRWVGWLAIAAMTIVFIATFRLMLDVLQHGPREIVAGGWPPGLGITMRADELGIVFALVSNGVLLIALIYEVLEGVHERAMPALVLFLSTGLTGLFLTGDAFNFYVFFEISMTTSFVLATYGQRQREIRAALIFTVVNLLGSVFFLSAIASLYHLTGTLDMRALTAAAGTLEQNSIILTAAFIFVAFGVKLGLFPFHFWLPPVYRDTWPAVAAILSGAVANIGSYGLLRFGAGILSRELRLSAGVADRPRRDQYPLRCAPGDLGTHRERSARLFRHRASGVYPGRARHRRAGRDRRGDPLRADQPAQQDLALPGERVARLAGRRGIRDRCFQRRGGAALARLLRQGRALPGGDRGQ